jgi:hypothetical protein
VDGKPFALMGFLKIGAPLNSLLPGQALRHRPFMSQRYLVVYGQIGDSGYGHPIGACPQYDTVVCHRASLCYVVEYTAVQACLPIDEKK